MSFLNSYIPSEQKYPTSIPNPTNGAFKGPCSGKDNEPEAEQMLNRGSFDMSEPSVRDNRPMQKQPQNRSLEAYLQYLRSQPQRSRPAKNPASPSKPDGHPVSKSDTSVGCTCCDPSDSHEDPDGLSELSQDCDDCIMTSLVQDSYYERKNLAQNKVYFLDRYDPLPAAHANLADRICGQPRASPEPTVEEFAADSQLRQLRGLVYEHDVVGVFLNKLAPPDNNYAPLLKLSRQVHIHEKHVPNNADAANGAKLSKPVPDLIYGYSSVAFPRDAEALDSGATCDVDANGAGLMLPFLAIEVQGQWPATSDNLCVAENQVIGSSAACVKIAEDLKKCLEESANPEMANKLDTTAFSIATNGSEARLFITWREGSDVYKMKHLRSYCLGEAGDRIQFRRAVRNIFQWGYTERLNQIRTFIAIILEKSN